MKAKVVVNEQVEDEEKEEDDDEEESDEEEKDGDWRQQRKTETGRRQEEHWDKEKAGEVGKGQRDTITVKVHRIL